MAKTKNKKKRKKFEYKKRTKEQAKKAQESTSDYDRYLRHNMWSPGVGKHTVRFLPPTWEPADHYGLTIFCRYRIGPDKQTYLALDKHVDLPGHEIGPDPIEEARARALSQGREKEKWINAVKAKPRILVWVIVRGEEKKGPQLWAMPIGLNEDFLLQTVDEESGDVLPVDDPYGGYDGFFNKKKLGKQPWEVEYKSAQFSRRSSPLSDDKEQMEEWLQFIQDNPLPECLKFYSYDYIKKTFEGTALSRDGDADDEPKTRKQKKRKKYKADDDIDFATGKKKKKKKNKPIDDEDASLDGEEEPKKKKKKHD